MDLTIIVPVYNTEKYLKECVGSIVHDIPKKVEVLLIDNGSKDRSLEICHGYAKKYEFITVLECKTPGASAVKNFGLKRAKGEYVWFIDSDDYIRRGAVRDVLKRIRETQADLVMIGAVKVDENGGKLPGGILRPVGPEISEDWRSKFIRYGLGPWQVIAKREFLTQNQLWFDEGMIHEDIAIISSYILHTDAVTAIPGTTYFYRQRRGSVLHGEKWNAKELDIFAALELLSRRFEKVRQFKRWKAELEYFYIWNLLDDAVHEFAKFPEGRENFERIRKTLDAKFPAWRKNRYFKECPIAVRMRCRLAYRGIVK